MGFTGEDVRNMSLALVLAQQSRPSPNPRVGAIIVKGGRIIGKGYHHAPGQPHAEIEALRDAQRAGENVSEATMYVTLEPCCHYGRTGPCCEAIHEAGISRIVVGMRDPDNLVSGKGIQYLKEKGHPVDVGVCEAECRQMLDTYIQHRTLGRPLIHMKAAMTMDGYIAALDGDSKWITGRAARAYGHSLRATYDAILIGIGTVLADNPTLTARDTEGQNPTRIILDSRLQIPLDSNLIQTISDAGLVILHGSDAPQSRLKELQRIEGIELHCCALQNHTLAVSDIVKTLAKLGFLGVLVEGGSKVNGAFIQSQMVDKLSLFIAPKMLGKGIPWATLPAIPKVGNALSLIPDNIRVTQLDNDTLIEGVFAW